MLTRDAKSLLAPRAPTRDMSIGQGLSIYNSPSSHSNSRSYCRGLAPVAFWTTVPLLKLERESQDKDATEQPFDPSRVTMLPHQRHLLFLTESELWARADVTAVTATIRDVAPLGLPIR